MASSPGRAVLGVLCSPPACVSLPRIPARPEKAEAAAAAPEGQKTGEWICKVCGLGKCAPWTGTWPPRRVRGEGHTGEERAAGVPETGTSTFRTEETKQTWAGQELPSRTRALLGSGHHLVSRLRSPGQGRAGASVNKSCMPPEGALQLTGWFQMPSTCPGLLTSSSSPPLH